MSPVAGQIIISWVLVLTGAYLGRYGGPGLESLSLMIWSVGIALQLFITWSHLNGSTGKPISF